jgi:hypothetical protein
VQSFREIALDFEMKRPPTQAALLSDPSGRAIRPTLPFLGQLSCEQNCENHRATGRKERPRNWN